MAKIPKTFIETLKQRINIIDIISKYTELKKYNGEEYKGSCPFHTDANPSFYVNEQKGVYKCFSCQRQGNVFNFLMEKEGLSYPESILYLAKEYNMDQGIDFSSSFDSENQETYNLNAEAVNLYNHILLNTVVGEEALRYLINDRKLSKKIILDYKIGFVPDSDSLVKYFLNKNISFEKAIKANLAFLNDGVAKDQFFGRIVFPIQDEYGNYVGFSGRALYPDQKPKYMNSKESDVFKKSNLLFNLNKAKASIKSNDYVILCEGFMDVLSAVMSDSENVVAAMGTALTPGHISKLQKLTNNIVLSYDGDEAGIGATKKAISLIQSPQYKNNFNCKIATMPENLDPDEVRLKFGLDRLHSALTSNFLTPIEFLIKLVKNNVDKTANYTEYVNKILQILLHAQPVEIDKHIGILSSELNITRDALLAQFSKIKDDDANKQVVPKAPVATKTKKAITISENDPWAKENEYAEQGLIMAMLKDKDCYNRIAQDEHIHFFHELYQTLYWLMPTYHQMFDDYNIENVIGLLNNSKYDSKLRLMDKRLGKIEVNKYALQEYLYILREEMPRSIKISKQFEELKSATVNKDYNREMQAAQIIAKLKLEQEKE